MAELRCAALDPQALKLAAGMVNAISGGAWSERIEAGEQDYVVCPPQPWIDGFKSADGVVRQFIAMPLGMGYTVEGQVTGEETFGGLQLVVFDAVAGRFPNEAPISRPLAASPRPAPTSHDAVQAVASLAAPRARARRSAPLTADTALGAVSSGAEMGLGAGGLIDQKLYPDPFGADCWDSASTGRIYVHIVNSRMYAEITGRQAPESPISAKTYAEHGLPWFALYDEHLGDVEASGTLAGVRSVKQLDADKGFTPQQDDEHVEVAPQDVKREMLKGADEHAVIDGSW